MGRINKHDLLRKVCLEEADDIRAAGITGFVLTGHELYTLVKYWTTTVLDISYNFFIVPQMSGRESRRSIHARLRIDHIEEFLGAEDVSQAMEEANEEFRNKHHIDAETWRIFTSGDEAEQKRFRESSWEKYSTPVDPCPTCGGPTES